MQALCRTGLRWWSRGGAENQTLILRMLARIVCLRVRMSIGSGLRVASFLVSSVLNCVDPPVGPAAPPSTPSADGTVTTSYSGMITVEVGVIAA